MNIKQTLEKIFNKQKAVKTKELTKLTGFSRAYLNRFLQELVAEGKIVLIGRANRALYVQKEDKKIAKIKNNELTFRRFFSNSKNEEDVLEDLKNSTGIVSGLSKNVLKIFEYAFTEMLNNAFEHARSPLVEIVVSRNKSDLYFKIIDHGVGVFNNLRLKKKLKNELAAIQDLLKGKQTTAAANHSGEGIFFTSHLADRLILDSFKKKLVFDNLKKDVFIQDIRLFKGTKVSFYISLGSTVKISEVFKRYAGNLYEFDKTEVLVRLYRFGKVCISRSQARRVLAGLEKFKFIVFDFAGLESIGQAFADEIFRVWVQRYPDIKIVSKNTNKNINFMISRAVNSNINDSTYDSLGS